jgi:hypothetical protein
MSGWRIKGTAGPLANQAWPLQGRLNFIRDDDGVVRVSARAEGQLLATLALGEDAAPRLERKADDIALQVNGEDWSDGGPQLGDEIRVGTNRFLLQAPGLRPDRVLVPDHAPARAWKPVVLLALLVLAAAAAWWLLR